VKSEVHMMRTIAATNENFITGVMAIDDSNAEIKGKAVMGDIYVPNGNEQMPVAVGLANITEVRRQLKRQRKR
jgi:hypothetical protein